jgi:transcription antitermination factor NusG
MFLGRYSRLKTPWFRITLRTINLRTSRCYIQGIATIKEQKPGTSCRRIQHCKGLSTDPARTAETAEEPNRLFLEQMYGQLSQFLAIGGSEVHLVALGQESSLFHQVSKLSSCQYAEKELVSVTRSNGSSTIAQIANISSEYISLDLGNALEKQIPSPSVPNLIFKLVGRYCLAGRIRIQGPGTSQSETISPLRIGQDCSRLASFRDLPCKYYYRDELVAIDTPEGNRVVGLVRDLLPDRMEVVYGGHAPTTLSAQEIQERVQKIAGQHYCPDLEELATIKIGGSSFRPCFLGQESPADLPRSKGYICSDFSVGEPVAVKTGSASRVIGEVTDVDPVRHSLSVLVKEADGRLAVHNLDGDLEVSEVCKLDVGVYLVDHGGPVDLVFDPSCSEALLGRTMVRCLVLGQPSTPESLVQARHYVHHEGLAVAALKPDGTWAIGRVNSMSGDGRVRVETADDIMLDLSPLECVARLLGSGHYLAMGRRTVSDRRDELMEEVVTLPGKFCSPCRSCPSLVGRVNESSSQCAPMSHLLDPVIDEGISLALGQISSTLSRLSTSTQACAPD